jgi:hypothetical protein
MIAHADDLRTMPVICQRVVVGYPPSSFEESQIKKGDPLFASALPAESHGPLDLPRGLGGAGQKP